MGLQSNIYIFLALCVALYPFQSPAMNGEFSVYCTSNMDGTGRCKRIDNDDFINCIIIPGGVIACRDKAAARYECVQYGAISANQTQFACIPDTKKPGNNKDLDQNSIRQDNSSQSPTTDPLQQNKITAPQTTIDSVLRNKPKTKPTINDKEFIDAF
jgi:hypothetical protein